MEIARYSVIMGNSQRSEYSEDLDSNRSWATAAELTEIMDFPNTFI